MEQIAGIRYVRHLYNQTKLWIHASRRCHCLNTNIEKRIKMKHDKGKTTTDRKTTDLPSIFIQAELRRNVLLHLNLRDKVQMVQKPTIGAASAEKINHIQKNINKKTNTMEYLCSVDKKRLFLHVQDFDRDSKLLEKVCCLRIGEMTIQEMLYIADVFYSQAYECVRYRDSMFDYLCCTWYSIQWGVGEILHLLLNVAVNRSVPAALMSHIEKYIGSNIEQFTADQLVLICHAFFISKTPLTDYSLMHEIITKIIREINNRSLTLKLVSNIAKSMRHAAYDNIDDYDKFAAALVDHPDFDKLTPNTLMHVASAFASVRIYHAHLFSRISKRFQAHVSNDSQLILFRSKDLGRTLGAFGVFGHTVPQVLLESLIRAMTEDSNYFEDFPQVFIENLASLAMLGSYRHSLVHSCLNTVPPDGTMQYAYQTILLDTAVGIEDPHYKGARLPQSILDRHLTRPAVSLHSQVLIRQGFRALLTTMTRILGAQNMDVRIVLPFSNLADIIIHVDHNDRPLTTDKHPPGQEPWLEYLLPSSGNNQKLESIIQHIVREKLGYTNLLCRLDPSDSHIIPDIRPDREHEKRENTMPARKLLVRVTGWKQYLLNEPRQTGHHLMETRLLQKLGYECYLVGPEKAAEMDRMNDAAKEEYCMEILQRCQIHL